MSDDRRRDDDAADDAARRRPGSFEAEMDSFDPDEFGGPLFGATTEQPVTSFDDEWASEEKISFGSDESGSLPHWTDPPTGEVPKIAATEPADSTNDDLDVWSSFASDSAPVESERAPAEPPKDPTGELVWHDDVAGADDVPPGRTTGQSAAIADEPVRREPARITIGTDPSGMPRRPEPKRRGGSPQRPPSAGATSPGADGRNLPVAVASGLVLAAVFLAAAMWRPAAAVAFVTVALGLAAIEYFSRVTDKGYRPAIAVGVAACVAAPLAAYWVGDDAIALVVAFAFLTAAVGFIAADSIESGPMPNMAITMLGVVWIGVLGAYAALILRWSTFGEGTPWGTDTLVLIALGVVANDVGAYFTGSAVGKTPLRPWISPNKSLEGLLGGTILTLLVMFIVGLQDLSDTWSNTGHLLWLGIVISIAAPLGDLTESMFKRNLDVKDFGAIVRGHGGILDRFDGFLFTLPAVYYLFRVLEPWTAL
ncbi:MAG TPA: phosphatidate cytidylyltransferase [Ilumatobacteraceae bacterium]|nr:phosphatidate cytidylyltransferase [Ilumatobacteraceae bacterium]